MNNSPLKISSSCLYDLLINKWDITAFNEGLLNKNGYILTLSDIEIYNSLVLNQEKDAPRFFKDFKTQYFVSFFIRHAACSLMNKTDKGELLAPRGFVDYEPIVGFSTLGVHFSLRKKGSCLAFDFYSLQSCLNGRDNGEYYCLEHDADYRSSLTQTVMRDFYSDLLNIDLYSESDLEALFGEFWIKLQKYGAVSGAVLEPSELALKLFGFDSIGDLEKYSMSDLRKIYVKKSLVLHPDRGGDEGEFQQLHQAYAELKNHLELNI